MANRADDQETTIRIPGFCALCRSRCGCINVVENGVLVGVEPDPDHPTGAALCAKGRAAPDLVASVDRLLRPLKRTRPKDEPDAGWVPIEWDEALETTAAALRRLAAESGPESVAFSITTPSGTAISDSIQWIERLKNAFGSPNDCYGTEICNWHKDHAHRFTFGSGIGFPDYARTRCMVFWGHNPSTSWLSSARGAAAARSRGAKLVIVDPRRAGMAAKADLWLRVRPGSDGALALGVANVLIERRWFDEAFVRRWTNGPLLVRDDNGRFLTREGKNGLRFLAWHDSAAKAVEVEPIPNRNGGTDGLSLAGVRDVDGIACRPAFEHYANLCRRFSPDKVAALTWIAADDVVAMARLLHDSRPVSYYAWSGVGQHTNATQTDRAIALLHSLTGDHEAPGGNVHFAAPPVNDATGWELLPQEQRDKTLGLAQRPLGPPRQGWITSDDLYTAILERDPYAVRGLVGFGANLLLSHADGRRGAEALAALDFYVHADLFMTPTASFADIVLPINTPWEREGLRVGFEAGEDAAAHVQLRPAAIPTRGKSRSDTWVVFQLATRLGLGDAFWNGDVDAGYRHILSPSGVTLEALRARPRGVSVPTEQRFRRFAGGDERLNGVGFATETGRIEVYSEHLLRHGYAPVPEYVEPTDPISTNSAAAEAFPLILTSAKLPQYCHSQHRNLARLRRIEPDPIVEIHPDAAATRNITTGDWVSIATPTGRIRMRARLRHTLDPRVAAATHGWWQGCDTLGLPALDALGEDGANLNLLIPNDAIDPISGSVPHRAWRCEIRRIDD